MKIKLEITIYTFDTCIQMYLQYIMMYKTFIHTFTQPWL